VYPRETRTLGCCQRPLPRWHFSAAFSDWCDRAPGGNTCVARTAGRPIPRGALLLRNLCLWPYVAGPIFVGIFSGAWRTGFLLGSALFHRNVRPLLAVFMVLPIFGFLASLTRNMTEAFISDVDGVIIGPSISWLTSEQFEPRYVRGRSGAAWLRSSAIRRGCAAEDIGECSIFAGIHLWATLWLVCNYIIRRFFHGDRFRYKSFFLRSQHNDARKLAFDPAQGDTDLRHDPFFMSRARCGKRRERVSAAADYRSRDDAIC